MRTPWGESFFPRLFGTVALAIGVGLLFLVFAALGDLTRVSPWLGVAFLVMAAETARGLRLARTWSRLEAVALIAAAGVVASTHPTSWWVVLVGLLVGAQPMYSVWLLAYEQDDEYPLGSRLADLACALSVLGLVVLGPT